MIVEDRAATEAARVAAEGLKAVPAGKLVAIWNSRLARGAALWFNPTIGAAIAAGRRRLTFVCPACRVTSAVDLRTLDRHPGGSLHASDAHSAIEGGQQKEIYYLATLATGLGQFD